jgi:putative transposase
MKRSKFTSEQIAFALRQAETGMAVQEITRKMGISEQTFYRWKRKFAGLGIPELRRLKLLEQENRKLKRLVADLIRITDRTCAMLALQRKVGSS